MNFQITKNGVFGLSLKAKVFVCKVKQMKRVRSSSVQSERLERDFVGALVTGVALRTRFAAFPSLPFLRFLEGALPKIKDSSAADIEPKTNPTGRDCDPPGGQSLSWRNIGSNAGFIQL